MTYICFTGIGDVAGRKFDRSEWIVAMQMTGQMLAVANTKSCDWLVSSRDDTVKARQARMDGNRIISYEQFLREIYDLGATTIGGVQIQTLIEEIGGVGKPWVSAQPINTDALEDAMSGNSYWGTF